MSRLIRTNESANQKDSAVPIELAQSKIVILIKACKSLCNNLIQDGFKQFLTDYEHALNHAIDNAKSNQQVQDLIVAQREFKRSEPTMIKLFCFSLAQGFNQFSRNELNTKLEKPKDSSDHLVAQSLTLLDDDTLNESIAVSSLMLKTQIKCKEALWLSNRRFSILNQGELVKSHNNPISPVQFCMAFKHALANVNLNQEAKALAYTVFTKCIVDLCENILHQTNNFLKDEGVLPYLNFTHSHRAAKNPRTESSSSSPFEPIPRFTPEESALNQEKIMSAIKGLQEAAALQLPIAAEYVENARVLDVFKQLQTDSARNLSTAKNMQKKGEPLNIEASNIAGQNQFISKALDTSAEKQLDQNSSKTIDLVGRVFSFMLSDQTLPNEVKALLSHLHTPFLKIAFIDTQFFEQVEHPARELLDVLAEAGAHAKDNNEALNIQIYDRIQETVNTIVTDFDSDLRMITKILMDFKRYIKSLKHRQQLTERRTTEKIKGKEKLEAVKSQVNNYIQSTIANREVPSAVLIFLLQPWSDYLSFVLLRYSDQSEQWVDAKKVVDDLLWSICSHASAQNKALQAKLKTSLEKTIRSGFAAIAYDEVHAKKFIDALNFIIEHAINNRSAVPASSEVREKIEKKAASKAGNITESSASISGEEAKMIDNLKYLEFGSWFELENAKRLKLAWFNKRKSTYLFVDQTGRQVEMISTVDMARGLITKKIKLIPSSSSKPFFERALESIYEQMRAKYNKENT